MSEYHGKFVWYELMTTDMKGAEAFYGSVVGWTAKDAANPAMAYTLFNAGDTGAGGLMVLPKAAADMGLPPHWIGYIAVDDVDVYAAKIKEEGGAVHVPPSDIPGIGRFAVVGDPQGASFSLFKPLPGMEAPPVAPDAIGHTGWRELYTSNQEAAFAFYSKLFGWTKADAMDMGDMGVYQLFAIGGVPVGGMMNKPPSVPHPVWGFYFNVDGINDAIARVKAGGGQVVNGPHQVPGGSWIIQGVDPQGAMFALVSAKA